MAYIKIPLKNVLNIRTIITMHYFDFSPQYKTKGETHDFWEMVYVDSGELDIRGGEHDHHLHQGDVIFHKPNEFHDVRCDGIHTASIFLVTFDCTSPAMKFFHERWMTVPGELRSAISAVMEEGVRNFEIGRYPLRLLPGAPIGGEQLFHMYLETFLIRLMRWEDDQNDSNRLFTSQETLEDCLANDIVQYMKEHLYETLTLDDICSHFHFGKSYLCRVFKENTGHSIMQYYTEMKVTEAKLLLHTTQMSITHISERLGFENPQYFARVFRKLTGNTPREYRKSSFTKFAKKGAPLRRAP